ncbi:hypothetical protein CPB86DRAFT_815054 [Serendipita vermifera]|nr:hypothetical protein CPB86DRAFT_815054 [Serendipita vermifera]
MRFVGDVDVVRKVGRRKVKRRYYPVIIVGAVSIYPVAGRRVCGPEVGSGSVTTASNAKFVNKYPLMTFGELISCQRCDRGWHISCLSATGIQEPPELPDCPECRPPSMQNSKAPTIIPKPPETSLPPRKRSASPFVQPSQANPKATSRKSRKQASISSISHKTLQSPTTPVAPAPPLNSITNDHTPAVEPPLILGKPKFQQSRIKLRLPPKKKGDAESSPKRRAFEEILSSKEADTAKTTINADDKARFETSKVSAENRLGVPLVPPPGTPLGVMTPQPLTPKATPMPNVFPTQGNDSPFLGPRPLKSVISLPHLQPSNTPGPSTPRSYKSAVLPKGLDGGSSALRIRTIRIGCYEVNTWYDAPFPEEYAAVPDGKLYMCEFCLKYMKSPFGADRHRMKCTTLHPPGDEIYRDGNISIFEVDGRLNKIYCQNLCLLSKMFLDHKSLFYDVEPFLFYVMTEVDENGAHFVGYFSKEKRSAKDFNLSCIMTLPVKQKSGWGNLLIDFSYLLTLKEGRFGTPERPLSKLGAIAYGRYWQHAVYKVLQEADPKSDLRMEDICRETRMTLEDVFNTLRTHGLISLQEPPQHSTPAKISSPASVNRVAGVARNNLTRKNSNISKQHLSTNKSSSVSIYDLTVVPDHYLIKWNRRDIQEYLQKVEAKGLAKLRPEKLRWSPYLVSRAQKSHLGVNSGVGGWEVELEDRPEPSMHSHTPLEPVPRPPTQRSNSGRKTPRRNGSTTTSGKISRSRTAHQESPTLSADQASIEWMEDIPDDDEDDDFKDDDSTSPELRKITRQRHGIVPVRKLTRRTSNLRDDDDSDGEDPWEGSPTPRRRTRSGRPLGSLVSVGSDSDWEQPDNRLRTRSRSHATRSTRRGLSSSVSLSEVPDRDDLFDSPERVDDSPEIVTSRLPNPPKKKLQRVIDSESESGDEREESPPKLLQPHELVTDTEPQSLNSIGPYLNNTGEEDHAGVQVQTDSLIHGNGQTSDDQLPETPQVVISYDQTQTNPNEATTSFVQMDDKANEWMASYPIQLPIVNHKNDNPLPNGMELQPHPTSPIPTSITPTKTVQQIPRASSEDAVMEEVGHGWLADGEPDNMDVYDEDAEGEDEDAEGEDDLTFF